MKMKSVMIFCVTFVFIFVSGTSFFSYAESEESKFPAVYFNDIFFEDTISGNKLSQVVYMTEDNVSFLRIYANTGDRIDPFIYFPIGSIPEPVSCKEYYYLLIRVRASYPGNDSRLYFGTTVEPGLDENKSLPFYAPFRGNGKWETAVVEFKYSAHYDGFISTVRFDPYGNWPEGLEYIDIAWFGFVRSEKDLDSFEIFDPTGKDEYSYTREPVSATPDRTKSPRPTPSGENSSVIDEKNAVSPAKGNLTLTVIISAVCLAVFVSGIIVLNIIKKKTTDQ